jgi:hypothetical protein
MLYLHANLKAIHNKDYSVVKTVKAVLGSPFFLAPAMFPIFALRYEPLK